MRTPLASDIPVEIRQVVSRLEEAGHRAYLVGGAVRDLCLERTPVDWDVCTSAKPDEILALFSRAHATGAKYGTVSVLTPTYGPVEVTTFRREGPYSDGRRPDYVQYTTQLTDDLSRRDFTCNALAFHPEDGLVDHFNGVTDLKAGILRCVGDPIARLQEDNLRILRAFRFQVKLGLRLDPSLAKAICVLAHSVSSLPPERIGGEMFRLLEHPEAYKGIRRMRATGVLREVLPELMACYGLEQNQYHAYTVYGHTLVALKQCANEPEVRTALLMHDLGKAVVAEQLVNGVRRFWGHQEASALLAKAILQRWSWPRQSRQRIIRLVQEHMFYWPQDPTNRALRRFIGKVGPEIVLALMEIRKADIIALGPTGKRRLGPWRVLQGRIAAMLAGKEVLSLHNLAITGRDLICELKIPQGPGVGKLLAALFEAVISEKVPNDRGHLLNYAKTLSPDDASH